MLKRYLTLALVGILVNVVMAGPALAQPQSNNQRQSVESVKVKVAKLGTGEKARANVRLTNGTQLKGYITEARDDDFVMRDRKTNEARTVTYAEVTNIEKVGGHSTARNVAIGVAVGAGAVVAIILGIIAHLD